MSGTRFTSKCEWLQSDVSIIFVVVLLLVVIILVALCFIIRRRRRLYRKPEKMTQMEIFFPDFHLPGSDTTTKPKFIMKIITEEKHASKIVQIVQKDQPDSPIVRFVTPPVASTSQDRSRDPYTEIDDPGLGASTLWDMPSTSPPKHSVTALTKIQSAKVLPSKEDSDSSESGEY